MNKTLPRISIVTPSFNQGRFIEKTIQSVLNQNYPNLEYIIIDGGSTDNTVDVIRKYNANIHFWVSERDRGQSHAINKGFERTTGEIITWLNSDDILMPGALFTMADAFIRFPQAGAIVGHGELIDSSGRVVGAPARDTAVNLDSLFRWMRRGNYFLQPSCFFTRQAWVAAGPLREDLFFCMDLDLWIKIAKSYSIERIDACIANALIHPDAKTTAFNERMQAEIILLIKEHGAHEIAREEIFRMADKVHEYNRVRKNMVFRKLIKPFLRRQKSGK